MLEYRRLLSAIPNPQAAPDGAVPLALSQPGHASPPGFSPTQISTAYGINNIKFNGVTGDGTGQTIAIIGAFDNPAFVNTGDANFDTSDLHLFDTAMGLPDPPSFRKVDQNGGFQLSGEQRFLGQRKRPRRGVDPRAGTASQYSAHRVQFHQSQQPD